MKTYSARIYLTCLSCLAAGTLLGTQLKKPSLPPTRIEPVEATAYLNGEKRDGKFLFLRRGEEGTLEKEQLASSPSADRVVFSTILNGQPVTASYELLPSR